MNVFELIATLNLNTNGYTTGLSSAKSALSGFSIFSNQAFARIDTFAINTLKTTARAVAGFVKSSVDAGTEFDSAMLQVAATMGKTMNEMLEETGTVDLAWGKFTGNLREYAQEMGKNTKFKATEAAEALNYMALAGYIVQTSMEMLPSVLNLAAAGNFNLARASDMVTDTQTAFGLSLERTALMIDEMAKAASTGNTSVEQLGDAFLTIGGLAKELNGGFVTLADGTRQLVDGIKDLEIALTAMANAGVKGSAAGTHMRNMLMKLSSPTSEGTKRLEEMGVAVFDASGNMRSLVDIFGSFSRVMATMTQQEKLQTISDLFNARDTASAEALLAAVEQDWNNIGQSILKASEAGVLYRGQLYSMEEAQRKFGDAIHDSESGFKILGSAEFMAMEQMNNLAGDAQYLQSALEGVQIAVNDALTPALRGLTQAGTRGLSELAEKLDNANFREKLANIGEKLGNLADKAVDFLVNDVDWDNVLDGIANGIDKGANAVQFLFDNSDKIIPVIKTLLVVLAAWKVAQIAINIAMLANPISLIVLAIAALVAAGIALYMNWDIVKEKAEQLWIKIRDTFSNISMSINNAFLNAINSAKNWGSDLINNFEAGITNRLSALKTTVSNMANTIRSYLHFSEPDVGPLSDFHTYAPDMMKLFARGIADNEHLVTDQIEKSFDFGRKISDSNNVRGQRSVPSGEIPEDKEIVLSIDGHELARFLAPAINSQLAFGRA